MFRVIEYYYYTSEVIMAAHNVRDLLQLECWSSLYHICKSILMPDAVWDH